MSKSKHGKLSHRRPPAKDPPKIKYCLFCGGTHALERKFCPASGQKCKKWGKGRYFAINSLLFNCRSKSEHKNVRMVEQEEVLYIHSISGKDQALASHL